MSFLEDNGKNVLIKIGQTKYVCIYIAIDDLVHGVETVFHLS